MNNRILPPRAGLNLSRLPWPVRLAPLLLLACSLLTGPYLAPEPTPAPPASPTPAQPPATLTAPPATVTALSPTASPAPTVAPLPTHAVGDIYLADESVIFHPGPELYSGDRISFEILAENEGDQALNGLPVTIYSDFVGGPIIASGRYTYSGIAQRVQATFDWAWDTTGLAGEQTVVIAQDPTSQVLADDPDLSNNVITVMVNLLPVEARPGPENGARWARADAACCTFYYLTGTAADRDIEHLELVAQEQVDFVEEMLDVSLNEPLRFTLLSRLLGHGGFAGESIAISYLDRDFAGGDVPQVFRHEATHILDRQIARTRPTIMGEGLAVYVSGGHFKVEDLDARAVAVLALNRYIPLAELADNFYPSQHEIGYMEAGAFIQYLVDTYGWERFRTFYGSFTNGPDDLGVLDAALRLNFDLSLAQTEAAWLAHLRSLPVEPEQVTDVRDTVAFYDTVRRYQELYDPTAHYMTAWLPDVAEMRREGIVADYLRHPTAPGNIALEAMLVEAAAAIGQGDYARAEWLTASANSVLGAAVFAPGSPPPFSAFDDPLAAQYLGVVQASLAAGYEPQQIALNAGMAQVSAIREWPDLASLTFAQNGADWVLNTN